MLIKEIGTRLEEHGYQKNDYTGKYIIPFDLDLIHSDSWNDFLYTWGSSDGEKPYPAENFEQKLAAIRMKYESAMYSITAKKLYPKKETFDTSAVKELLASCCEISLTAEDFLKHEFLCDIGLDTGDSNYDYTSNTVHPAYGAEYHLYETKRSSLIWLTRQQGYQKGELYRALSKITDDEKSKDIKSDFIRSIAYEVWHEVSDFNQLFFFTRFTGEQILNLNSLMVWHKRTRKWAGYIIVDKSACCGLYDYFCGGSSLIRIRPEKNVKIPVKYIRFAVPDSFFRWSMRSIAESSEQWSGNKLLYVNYPKHFRRIMGDIGLKPIQKNDLAGDYLE